MHPVFLYVTTEGRDQAVEIGAALIESRLAACVNILDNMTSLFWWDGGVQEGRECVLIAKTRKELIDPATELIKEVHSYDCPCVVALPIEGGNRDFLTWIGMETADADVGKVGN